jgi:hypothetical protein
MNERELSRQRDRHSFARCNDIGAVTELEKTYRPFSWVPGERLTTIRFPDTGGKYSCRSSGHVPEF